MRIQTKSKYIALTKQLYDLFDDKEMLRSSTVHERANLLLLKVRFRGNMYDVALPWRSNLKPATVPTNSYYKLPPTTKTTAYHVACLDFNKLCILPNKKKNKNCYYRKYIVDDIKDAQTIMYIERNKKAIITKVQNYLNKYDTISDDIYHVDLDNCFNKLSKKDLL